jgi:hypothetical protein
MIRKVVVGLIWFVVLYFGACAVTGGIAGAIAANETPTNIPQEEVYHRGAQVGTQAVTEYREYLLFGAVLLAGAGSFLGLLPWTRPPLEVR